MGRRRVKIRKERRRKNKREEGREEKGIVEGRGWGREGKGG